MCTPQLATIAEKLETQLVHWINDQKAKTAYIEASQKGQSDSDVYEGLCALQTNVVQMQITQSGVSQKITLKKEFLIVSRH